MAARKAKILRFQSPKACSSGHLLDRVLSGNEKMSIMKWRASQPSGCAVPLSLQLNRKYKIGFCGDWFEGKGFGRIEGSIISSLKLFSKFKNLN